MESVELAVAGPIPRGTHFRGFIALTTIAWGGLWSARALRLPGAPRHIVPQVEGKV